jgi:hypothetical protein
MKAFSFSSLTSFELFGLHGLFIVPQNASTTHDLARDRVNQLYRMGVDDEMILAHLTGKRFGSAQPNDYRAYVS